MKSSRTIALSALLLVACGGSPSGEASTTLAPATTTPTTTTTTSTSTTTTAPPTTTTTTTTVPTGLVDPAACKLSEQAYSGVGIGFPRNEDRLQSTGSVQVAILLVDFPDVPATRTPQEAFALLAGTEEWFAAVSYGRLDVQLIPHPQWLRMSGPAAEYFDSITTYEGHKDWIEEAVTLADPEVDFTGIDEVVVLATPNADVIAYGPTWTGGSFDDGSITPDGQYITNGVTSGVDILYWGYLWLPHEMGHSLSFVDVYDYDGGPGYSGEFSLMNDIAGQAPEYLAWERWHAGWLDDDQILCVAGDTTATIGPIEVSGGPKAAVVKVGPNRVVVIESRRAVGYDHALQREGAVVYVVDTSIASGYGPIQMANDRLALLPGESVTVDGVTVTVSGATAGGDTIIIDL